MRPPNRSLTIRRLGVAVAVAVCVSLSGVLVTTSGPHRLAATAGGAAVRLGASSVAPAVTPAATGSAAGAPASWSGTTVATLLPNYNASLPGNFRSLVDDWQVGTPAVVPSTGTVWWPELPVSVDGSPAPTSAPALLYNLSTESFVGIDTSVTSASAFAFDPGTGLLYAADPLNDSVEAVNVFTGHPTGTSYAVGSYPTAIIYDPSSHDLFVANTNSNNVTVINPSLPLGEAIIWPGITVGTDPIAIADDSIDGWIYVANGGAASVSRLNTTNPAQPAAPVPLFYGPASGVAYSAKSGYVAATTASSTKLTVFSGKNGSVVPVSVDVGQGCRGIITAQDGSTFVVLNSSGASVLPVNASYPFNVSTPIATVGAAPTEAVVVSQSGSVLVWNNASRNVSVLASQLTKAIGGPLTLGPEPKLLAFDSSSDRLYIGDAFLPGIEQFNSFTGSEELNPIRLQSVPLALAVNPSRERLYVGLDGAVMAYNTTNGLLAAQNTLLAGANGPLAVDPTSGLLWVGRPAAGVVVALNLTNLAGMSLKVPLAVAAAAPSSLIVDPASGAMVAVNASDGDIVQFNGSSGALLGSPLSVGPNVTALAWDSADNLIYAAGDNLVAINPGPRASIAGSAALAPHSHIGGIVFDPSREAIYVGTSASSNYSGSLSVVNGSSAAAASTSLTVVPTGFEPSSLAAVEGPAGSLPDSGTILAANYESGTISVVASPPQILSASFDPAKVDENVSTRLVVAAVGGATTSSVVFTGLPSGCSPPVGLTVSCSPTEGGTFDVLATVTDALGEEASAGASLTVSSALALTASVGTLTSHEVDVNVPVVMSAEASGGSSPYTYAWNFGDGSTASGASAGHTFEATGEFIVAVTVTDQGGGKVVNETLVAVEADPAVHVSVSPGLSTDVDRTLELAASVTGGAGPGSGAWQFGDGTGSSVATVGHAWQNAGVYEVNYTYTDALGLQAKAAQSILVNPKLTGAFSIVPLSATPIVGTTFDFNATLENGTSGYTVEWSFGDGSNAVGAQVTHAYSASGSYTINVSAFDAAGAYLNESFPTITVGAGPSKAAPLLGGGFGPSFILGLVLGGAVAAVALFIAERARRAGPAGPPSPYVPPPPPATRGRS